MQHSECYRRLCAQYGARFEGNRAGIGYRAIGKISDDTEGTFLTDILNASDISTIGLAVIEREKTSFSDVMSVPGVQRTFFVYLGTSADFGIDDMNYHAIHAKILQKSRKSVWKLLLT